MKFLFLISSFCALLAATIAAPASYHQSLKDNGHLETKASNTIICSSQESEVCHVGFYRIYLFASRTFGEGRVEWMVKVLKISVVNCKSKIHVYSVCLVRLS